ncbi:MAG: DUF2304 family protein [Candidatus Woesearchaeota archaeon]
MEISVLQVIVVVFALFAWSRALLRLRDRKVSIGEFIFWSLIWAAVIVTSLLPQTANIASKFFGISRPIDLAVYISILLLLYLTFRIYVKHDQLEQEMTKLVREIAVRLPKKK